MLRSYFRTAYRHLSRYKLYSFINVFGLAIGFSAFMLILVYVTHELSYDKFHEDADYIYKVNLEFGETADAMESISSTPNALLPEFKRQFPEIIEGTRYFNPSSFRPPVVTRGDKSFYEGGFAYADSTFFDVFTFPLVAGDESTALTKPNSVVLSKRAATKYFGIEDPMGKELMIYGSPWVVTGMIENVPDNSHIQFDILGSFSSHRASRNEVWSQANYFTYLKLNSLSAADEMMPKIEKLLTDVGYNSPDEGFLVNVVMVPLPDLYLESEADALSDSQYIYIFSIIAALILIIAVINYMNLATARSSSRAREVGIRKVSGAFRNHLFAQFIIEAVLIALLSLVLSYAIVYILLPAFNIITGKAIAFGYLLSNKFLAGMIAVTLFTGLISGFYPAVVLSSFKPTRVLKGDSGKAGSGALLRQVLVVGQFGISIFMLIATLVVQDQLGFVQDRKLGYDRESIISVPVNRDIINSAEAFKASMISTGLVDQVTIAGETPVSIRGGYGIWVQGMEEDTWKGITAVAVDEHYVNTLNIELVAGENITSNDVRTARESEDGAYAYLLNESAVEMLGYTPEEAVGKKASMHSRQGVVKGVIKDFHFRSLHQNIGPLALFPENIWAYNYAMLKINSDPSLALDKINQVWPEVAGDVPFEFTFLDQEYDALYKSELKLGQVFSLFASIAILIACLGLFGMASFIAFQRAKEISVRKVLGASITNVLYLVSRQFVVLVVVAFVVSAPIAFIIMEQWLSDFVYRTSIGWWHIVAALMAAMVVSLSTVAYHALKSANSNPAEVLRSE